MGRNSNMQIETEHLAITDSLGITSHRQLVTPPKLPKRASALAGTLSEESRQPCIWAQPLTAQLYRFAIYNHKV